MKAPLLGIGLLALSLSTSQADTITGAILADMCVKHEPRASYYILGAVDAFNVRLGAPKRFCIPKGSDIPADHLTNIACKYVVEHAAQREVEAGVLVYRSLRDAYPCAMRR
ncbi:Rap1a/Tai family immunity protein [Lichenifustis flavocetrariae]|uniref:Rap1a immunity protein domain-containing protein n=1 Tax=Lichenifustis flavocetrariae TaxID=2949735 RepID=A0AA41YZV3_9HYPH|nr:Rap1a/Tai family immunity protein [Lichenifustis flavocetrariae]MCW6510282.1 hypothetical protein [Lichenifustis flavocetrariae]